MSRRFLLLIPVLMTGVPAPRPALAAGETLKDAPPHVHVSSKRELEVRRGPQPGEDWAAWLREQRRWREEFKRAIRFEATEYDRPELP